MTTQKSSCCCATQAVRNAAVRVEDAATPESRTAEAPVKEVQGGCSVSIAQPSAGPQSACCG